MTRWCRAEFVSEPRGGHGVTGSRGHQPNHDYQIINFGKLGITTI